MHLLQRFFYSLTPAINIYFVANLDRRLSSMRMFSHKLSAAILTSVDDLRLSKYTPGIISSFQLGAFFKLLPHLTLLYHYYYCFRFSLLKYSLGSAIHCSYILIWTLIYIYTQIYIYILRTFQDSSRQPRIPADLSQAR